LERSFTTAQRELERLQKSRREQPNEQAAEAERANIQDPKSDIPPLERPDIIYTAAPLSPNLESDIRQTPQPVPGAGNSAAYRPFGMDPSAGDRTSG
jgi:hypothetical protein